MLDFLLGCCGMYQIPHFSMMSHYKAQWSFQMFIFGPNAGSLSEFVSFDCDIKYISVMGKSLGQSPSCFSWYHYGTAVYSWFNIINNRQAIKDLYYSFR